MNKVILTIMDGVGLRSELHGNAVKMAKVPTIEYLWNKYPHSKLDASGVEVGLPAGQMGNSETGHTNIGAGRIVYQPLELINKSIRENSFFNNTELLKIMSYAKDNNVKLHVIGLISDGGVHSHINHIKSLLEMLKNNDVNNIYMHLITDGRDTLPNSGYSYVLDIENLNIGKISSICGRYYTMDRDNNLDRIKIGYDLIVHGIGKTYTNTKEVFDDNYSNDVTDEFILPSLLDKDGLIGKDDAIIWINFRPDRGREIITELSKINNHIVTMMPINDKIKCPYAFKLEELNNTLGEYLSKNKIKQLRIAETEKYAHVTYFFDGGVEKKLKGCDRLLIPSPKVRTYDLKPEMSAYEVTDKLLKRMKKYDVIILNFANGDMVGHTGVLDAAVKAVEVVDECLLKVYKKAQELGFTLVVTADHGNCEYMLDDDNNVITSHTTNKVPFIVCKDNLSLNDGKLSDIAPTMLELLNIKKPVEMTGNSLINN